MLDSYNFSSNLEECQPSDGFFIPIDQQKFHFPTYNFPSQDFSDEYSDFLQIVPKPHEPMFIQAASTATHELITEEPSPRDLQLSQDSSDNRVNNKTRHSTVRCTPIPLSNDDIAKYPAEVIEEIKFLALKYKRDWKKISKRIETQHKMVIDHFVLRQICKTLDSGNQKRVKFSEEDDEALLKAVEKESTNWFNVANYFPDRTPLSLRNRYYVLTKDQKGKKSSSVVNKQPAASKKRSPKNSQVSSKGKNCFGFQNELTEAPISLKTCVSDIVFKQTPAWLEVINSLVLKKI